MYYLQKRIIGPKYLPAKNENLWLNDYYGIPKKFEIRWEHEKKGALNLGLVAKRSSAKIYW